MTRPSSTRLSSASVAMVVTVAFMLLSLFSQSLLIARVSQVFPVAAVILLFPYLSPFRKFEFYAAAIALVFALLFLLNLVIFREQYLVGFAPVAMVSVAILGRRSFRDCPKLFSATAKILLLVLAGYCLTSMHLLDVRPNDLIVASRNHLLTVLLAGSLLTYSLLGLRNHGDSAQRLLGISSLLFAAGAMVSLGGRMSAFFGAATALLALEASLRLVEARRRPSVLLGFLLFVLLLLWFGWDARETDLFQIAASRFEERGLQTPRYEVWRTLIREGLRPQHWVGMPSDYSYAVVGLGTHSVWLQILTSHGILGLGIALAVTLMLLGKAITTDARAGFVIALVAMRATFDDNPYSLFMGPLFLLTWWLLVSDEAEEL